VTLRDVPRGTHQLRITHDGYVADERRVTVTASRPAQSVLVELAPPRGRASSAATAAPVSRYTGKLAVESRPSGATVYVDGKAAGTTPVSIGDVRAGEHAVRLERDGYRRWTASVRVVAGEQNRVTASLER
jgi:hypothetical protein